MRAPLAYVGTRSRRPPSNAHTDWPRALPRMSQHAVSMAESASVKIPPGPELPATRRSLAAMASVCVGSSPTTSPASVSTATLSAAVRHPVSTREWSCGGHALGGTVKGDVVRTAILPAAPQDAHPRAGQDADRMGMIAAPAPRVGIGGPRPGRGMARVVGEGRERLPQAFVAGPAEADGAVLAGFAGDGRDARLSRELLVGGEAGAIIAELGQDLSGGHAVAARQGLQERSEERRVGKECRSRWSPYH